MGQSAGAVEGRRCREGRRRQRARGEQAGHQSHGQQPQTRGASPMEGAGSMVSSQAGLDETGAVAEAARGHLDLPAGAIGRLLGRREPGSTAAKASPWRLGQTYVVWQTEDRIVGRVFRKVGSVRSGAVRCLLVTLELVRLGEATISRQPWRWRPGTIAVEATAAHPRHRRAAQCIDPGANFA